uniref:Uncharacterized protein n=1 Tax=Cucumis melo TaxID=3656 RepID=A0A9I9E824_CUCME
MQELKLIRTVASHKDFYIFLSRNLFSGCRLIIPTGFALLVVLMEWVVQFLLDFS